MLRALQVALLLSLVLVVGLARGVEVDEAARTQCTNIAENASAANLGFVDLSVDESLRLTARFVDMQRAAASDEGLRGGESLTPVIEKPCSQDLEEELEFFLDALLPLESFRLDVPGYGSGSLTQDDEIHPRILEKPPRDSG